MVRCVMICLCFMFAKAGSGAILLIRTINFVSCVCPVGAVVAARFFMRFMFSVQGIPLLVVCGVARAVRSFA